MTDTTSAAPSEADLEKFCDAFDWDGWTDQKAAQRAFARAALAKWGKTSPPAVVEPFTVAQRERMFRNRPSDVGKGLSLADWHRILQYVEAAHGIGIKKGEGNGN